MTDKEIIEKIYLGTMESASRKQINEANDLFTKLKSDIHECTTFLMDLAKKLGLFEVDIKDYDSFTLEQEIKRIEELLNPSFIHSESTNKLSSKEEEHKPFNKNLNQYLPTVKETITRIFDLKIRLEKSLLTIINEVKSLYYPSGLIYRGSKKIKPSKKINSDSDSGDYYTESNYCGACMSSPCMCSDFEQTSTLY